MVFSFYSNYLNNISFNVVLDDMSPLSIFSTFDNPIISNDNGQYFIPSFDINSIGNIETAYYLRLLALDRPGVLADIARILGEHKISIDSIRQKVTSSSDEPVSIVILTHTTMECRMAQAIPELEQLETIKGDVIRIRIETMDKEAQES